MAICHPKRTCPFNERTEIMTPQHYAFLRLSIISTVFFLSLTGKRLCFYAVIQLKFIYFVSFCSEVWIQIKHLSNYAFRPCQIEILLSVCVRVGLRVLNTIKKIVGEIFLNKSDVSGFETKYNYTLIKTINLHALPSSFLCDY